MTTQIQSETYHQAVNLTRTPRRPRAPTVVANPSVSTTSSWPFGSRAAEVFHPYDALSQKRRDITIATPGVKVELENTPALRVSSLLDIPLSDGSCFADDKSLTGFAKLEEGVGMGHQDHACHAKHAWPSWSSRRSATQAV